MGGAAGRGHGCGCVVEGPDRAGVPRRRSAGVLGRNAAALPARDLAAIASDPGRVHLSIAAPWHLLAIRRMPPYFDFTFHSGPGQYHGFFWFYFMNEHVLRFRGMR